VVEETSGLRNPRAKQLKEPTMRRVLWFCALTLIFVTPALADKIDGDWCHDAENFHIDGSAIRTPGGRDITGDYSRHAFQYLAPDGEKDAGAQILMRLMNEETVLLIRRVSGTDSPVETWIRCKPVS
jgi:hypothetical protein